MSLKEKIRSVRLGLHSIKKKYKKSSKGGSIHELRGIINEGRGLLSDIPITVRPPSGDFDFGFNMGSPRKRKGKKRRSSGNSLLGIAEQGW